MMRKLFVLAAFICIFSSCDDGDMTIEDINFDDVAAQRCNNIIYKIAGNEALILELPDATAFTNDITVPGAPRIYQISATNRVVYRSYDGDVASLNICGTIPPANPVVTEEWTASSGTIEITTTTVTSTGEFEGGEKIGEYRHNIIFRNIIFEKPDGSQLYETFTFGNLDTDALALPFNFDGTLERCGASDLLYDFVGRETIRINIDPALIASEVTPLGSPRTGLISQTTNSLAYRLYENGNGLLTAEHICGPSPALPAVLEEWIAVDGVSAASGIIEVTTTTNGSNFLHEIRVKNVTFKRGNSTFKLADNYLLGQIITN